MCADVLAHNTPYRQIARWSLAAWCAMMCAATHMKHCRYPAMPQAAAAPCRSMQVILADQVPSGCHQACAWQVHQMEMENTSCHYAQGVVYITDESSRHEITCWRLEDGLGPAPAALHDAAGEHALRFYRMQLRIGCDSHLPQHLPGPRPCATWTCACGRAGCATVGSSGLMVLETEGRRAFDGAPYGVLHGRWGRHGSCGAGGRHERIHAQG